MRKQVKISEVLHLAADKYLAHAKHEYDCILSKDRFSCCAIVSAMNDLYSEDMEDSYEHRRIKEGLSNMGLDVESVYCYQEEEDQCRNICSEKAQSARYIWLKWAALMAEEQGV